jgi:hypothetical protein
VIRYEYHAIGDFPISMFLSCHQFQDGGGANFCLEYSYFWFCSLDLYSSCNISRCNWLRKTIYALIDSRIWLHPSYFFLRLLCHDLSVKTELHNLHFSPDTIKGDKMKVDETGASCSTNGSDEKCMKSFCRKA